MRAGAQAAQTGMSAPMASRRGPGSATSHRLHQTAQRGPRIRRPAADPARVGQVFFQGDRSACIDAERLGRAPDEVAAVRGHTSGPRPGDGKRSSGASRISSQSPTPAKTTSESSR
jgi:hypothetical protein